MRCAFSMVTFLLVAIPVADAADIHRCIHPDGTVELRDRSCPPGTEEGRAVVGNGGSFSTIPESQPPEALLERAEQSVRRAGKYSKNRGRTARRDSELRCAEYETRVDRIDYRLRKGYTASQGNRLRAERRRIEMLLADACR